MRRPLAIRFLLGEEDDPHGLDWRFAAMALGVWPHRLKPTPAATSFRCSPTVVGPDGEVTLTLSLPHVRELGVRTRENQGLFIGFEQGSGASTPPVRGRGAAPAQAQVSLTIAH
jgi:hypothetical protein